MTLFPDPYMHERLSLLTVFIRLLTALPFVFATIYLQWQLSLQESTNTYFGVTVDPGFYDTPEGQRIYNRWNVAQWINTILCSGLFYLFLTKHRASLALFFGVTLLFIFGRIFLYRQANSSVRSFAIPQALQRTAVLVEPRPLPAAWKTAYIGFQLLFIALYAVTAVFVYKHRASLGGQLAYQANGYVPPGADAAVHNLLHAARAHALILYYRDLILAAETLVIMLWLGFGFLYRSRVADWQAESEGNDRYRRAVMLSVLWAEGFLLVQKLSFLWERTTLNRNPLHLLGLLTLFTSIGLLVSLGLLWKQYRERPYDLQDRIADDRWKWGQFYVDRNDPAWLVPSRMGMGQALNYGNPATWFLLLVITATLGFILAAPHATPENRLASEQQAAPPNAEWALYQLALQNMSAGDRKDAADTLVPFADTHRETMSAVASALAEQKLRLPDAQRLATAGVERVEKRTAKIDPSQIQPEDLRRMQRLAQAWDAMGAVYAAQGNDAAAEPYLSASWNLWEEGGSAKHLAGIHLRRGDTEGAKALLEESLSHSFDTNEREPILQQLRAMGDQTPYRAFRAPSEQFIVDAHLHNVVKGRVYLLQRSSGTSGALNSSPQQDRDSQRDLDAVQAALQSIHFKMPLPDNGPEIVLRNAMVNCLPTTQQCQVTIYPSVQLGASHIRYGSKAMQPTPDD